MTANFFRKCRIGQQLADVADDNYINNVSIFEITARDSSHSCSKKELGFRWLNYFNPSTREDRDPER